MKKVIFSLLCLVMIHSGFANDTNTQTVTLVVINITGGYTTNNNTINQVVVTIQQIQLQTILLTLQQSGTRY